MEFKYLEKLDSTSLIRTKFQMKTLAFNTICTVPQQSIKL